ncbi:MAG: ABC transporter ATP-binding protein [Bacillota bacterium]|nr:ABC transporter ATP-binding protein [Bacillota bacterium]
MSKLKTKESQDPQGWGKLLAYSRSYLPAFIIVLVLSATATILQIIAPNQMGNLTNEIVKGLPALVSDAPIVTTVDLNVVKSMVIFLAVLYGSVMVLTLSQGYILATATQAISKNLRRDISLKINKLPLKYFDRVSYGDILSRVTNDVDIIGSSLNQSASKLVAAITMFIGSITMMFINNWIMALTAIGSSIIGFIFMAVITGKSQKHFNKQQEDLGTTNGHIEEIYSNGRFGIAPDRAVEYLADGKGTQLNFKTMGAAAAAFREMGRVDDACFEEIRKDVKVRGGGK